MPFGWPDLQRSIVDGKYFLKQFVREEDDMGLFIASAQDGALVDVRLTTAGDERRREWSERVSRSTTLADPHLVHDIATGETRIDGKTYLYLATENVQERLADVVAERTLTPDEAQAVVESVLTALDVLHGRGYTHGKVTTASIVAAGDSVKLLMGSVRTLPSDELESRRAVTADLRELAETTTEILTGKHELGAGAQLPSPFREFVRASFGTEECRSPTAAQLLGVLHGQPLTAPKPVVPEPTAERERLSVVPEPAPVVASQEPVRFRPGIATAVLAALLVLVIAVVAYRSIAGRDASGKSPVRTRTSDLPVTEPTRPSPVAPAQPSTAASAPAVRGRWALIAAAYNNYDGAARRAAQLRAKWKDGEVTVFPARGQGSRYFVVAGSTGSRREAERLLGRARALGFPPDTYVTRLQF
jgi:hypothetical protein